MTEVVPRPDHARAVNLDNVATLADAMELCQVLAQSDLVPKSLHGKAANLLLIYLNGREIGLSFAQSLRALYSPGAGQVGMRVQLMLAKVREAGHDYRWDFSGNGDHYACVFYLKRSDSPNEYRADFSVADALAAKLVKRAPNGDLAAFSQNNQPLPWMTYRDDMLFSRAASRAVTRACPEVLLGLEVIDNAVVQEEVQLQPQDGPPAPPAPAGAAETRHAPAAPGEAVAEELAALDAQGRDAAPEPPGAAERDSPGMRSAAPTRPGPPEGQQWANQRQLDSLGRLFRQLGWDPRSHRTQVLQACTVFTRRPVSASGDLYSTEATQLATELGKIRRTVPDDGQPAVLQETVDAWDAEWQAFDPQGYAAAMEPQ